jgi:hypothetical protein
VIAPSFQFHTRSVVGGSLVWFTVVANELARSNLVTAATPCTLERFLLQRESERSSTVLCTLVNVGGAYADSERARDAKAPRDSFLFALFALAPLATPTPIPTCCSQSSRKVPSPSPLVPLLLITVFSLRKKARTRALFRT